MAPFEMPWHFSFYLIVAGMLFASPFYMNFQRIARCGRFCGQGFHIYLKFLMTRPYHCAKIQLIRMEMKGK